MLEDLGMDDEVNDDLVSLPNISSAIFFFFFKKGHSLVHLPER